MVQNILDIFRRGKAWKDYVQRSLAANSSEVAALEERVASLRRDSKNAAAQVVALEARLSNLQHELTQHNLRNERLDRILTSRFDRLIAERFSPIAEHGHCLIITTRGEEAIALAMPRVEATARRLAGLPPDDVVEAIATGAIRNLSLLEKVAGEWTSRPMPELLATIERQPEAALAWLSARQPEQLEEQLPYFEQLDAILSELDLIDFFARGSGSKNGNEPVPFDAPEILPDRLPAEPKRRSAVFLHNNYYHFNCLAAGLKARGWETVTVSLESPDSPQRQFYHGEDINLFDMDPDLQARKTRAFFREVPERFGALHFLGMGMPSFFVDNFENTDDPSKIPWDLLELRRHRMVIGSMPGGCVEGGLQSSIHALTGGICDRCVWQLRPDVCSDARSLAWNRKLDRLCDWVGLECDHATPERVSRKTVYGPVVTTLDPDRWHPDIVPPESMRIAREPGEIVVYHAVGNYEQRRKAGRDMKGTGAVIAAIEQLKSEKIPVRLIFAHDVPSTQVRFLQVQADIVVDQLNYGRYGANAREAMMLGKPTICRLSPRQAAPLPPLRAIEEVPILDGTEETVVDVLRELVLDPERRDEIGRRARAYALAWHGQDACAERYERVIDRIRDGLPPDTPDLYPPREGAGWLA